MAIIVQKKIMAFAVHGLYLIFEFNFFVYATSYKR